MDLSTLFETENECQKTEPVPIPLPKASWDFKWFGFWKEQKDSLGNFRPFLVGKWPQLIIAKLDNYKKVQLLTFQKKF